MSADDDDDDVDDDDVRKKLPAPPIYELLSMSPASTVDSVFVLLLLLLSSEHDPNILRMLMFDLAWFDGAIMFLTMGFVWLNTILVFAAWFILCIFVFTEYAPLSMIPSIDTR